MESLEVELSRARALSVEELAAAIESIGFECTRCGECCTAESTGSGETEPHTATLFPDEARRLRAAASADSRTEREWRDVARPMPYGLDEGEGGKVGETFEWAIQTDSCGDCAFYAESDDGTGACTVHEDRPLVCRTYPFSVVLESEASEGSSDASDGAPGGTSQPMGDPVDRKGPVRAHECEGLGRDISREEAEELARTLKERAIREIEEAIGVRDNYDPRPDADGVVVHDSEGQKRPDGTRHTGG